MKKLISIFLLVAMLISVIPCVALSAAAETTPIDIMEYDDAKVASNQVYTISSVEGFKKFVELLVSTNDKGRPFGGDHTTQAKDVTFKLMADIDLNPGWDAASYVNDADASDEPAYIWPAFTTLTFASIFDGNGHTVKGICQKNTAAEYSGIFGRAYGRNVTVKNLTILNSYSESSNMNGHGFLFGYMQKGPLVNIENVYIDARVVNTATAAGDYGVGGFIGGYNTNNPSATLTIKNSVFAGSIEVTGTPTGNVYAGGMVGRFNGGKYGDSYITTNPVIENSACYADITVKAAESAYVMVGGLLAYHSYNGGSGCFTVKNCVSDVNFTYTGSTAAKTVYGSAIGASRFATTPCPVNFDNIVQTGDAALLGCSFTQGSSVDTSAANYTASIKEGSDTAGVKVEASALTGIAAQATLTANNLTGWTATTMGKVLPRALVVNVPGVVETTVEGAATVLHGYQAKDAAGDTFDFRLVATVDVPENVTVEKVGFIITANYGTTTLTKEYRTNTVYNSVTGNTATGLEEYTAESLGGDYIFALAITGAPVLAEGAITLEVTTYYVSGTDTVYGETEVFTVTAPQNALN